MDQSQKKLREAEQVLIEELDQLKAEANSLYKYYRGGGDERCIKFNSDAISLRENHDFIKERVPAMNILSTAVTTPMCLQDS